MLDAPKEYVLLMTDKEAAEFIKFLDGQTPADDVLVESIRLQLIKQGESND